VTPGPGGDFSQILVNIGYILIETQSLAQTEVQVSVTAREPAAPPVLTSSSFNGIDFVEIANTQQTVLNVTSERGRGRGNLQALPTIDGGETIRQVAVLLSRVPTGPWTKSMSS